MIHSVSPDAQLDDTGPVSQVEKYGVPVFAAGNETPGDQIPPRIMFAGSKQMRIVHSVYRGRQGSRRQMHVRKRIVPLHAQLLELVVPLAVDPPTHSREWHVNCVYS